MRRRIVSSIVSFSLSLSLFSGLSIFTSASANAAQLNATNSNTICNQNVTSTSGATAEKVGNACVITFVSSGWDTTITNDWVAPTGVTSIEVMVVGGGGAGGLVWAGGGGAGSVLYGSSFQVSAGTSYAIQVGRGGAGATAAASHGGSGTQSSFGNWIAIGGGGGAGSGWNVGFYAQGASGGSGGGSGEENGTIPGGSVTAQSDFSGAQKFGNSGGQNDSPSGSQAGSGGGGAGTNGFGIGGAVSPRNGETRYPGKGGSGITIGIGGKNYAVAGGGGGGSSNAFGLGGNGLGGNGGASARGEDPVAHTGSGGGGGQITRGGNGASGVVVVAYTIPPAFPANSVHGTASEGQTLSLSAPTGNVFTSVHFASYGTPSNYIQGSCHATASSTPVSTAFLGKNSGSISVNNTTFVDPCGGTGKRLSIVLIYGPQLSVTTPTSGLTGTLNTSYTLNLSASGGAGTKSFAVTTGSLPSGLLLNSSTGVISGTPTAVGSSSIIITVTDSPYSVTASTTSITVLINAPPGAPTSLGATPGNAQLSIAFTAGTDNRSAITNYEYSTNGGLNWKARSPASAATPIVITTLSSSTATLVNGTTYTIVLRAINGVPGNSEASASVTGIPNVMPTISSVPVISGTTTQGQTLSVTNGTWANNPATYSYSWSRSTTAGGTYTTISGAISSTYNLGLADIGNFIRASVVATNSAGNSIASNSAATSAAVIATCSIPAAATQGAFSFLKFTSLGTCNWTPPDGIRAIDLLVVAGGGGGGSRHAGGGGAGGLINASNLAINGEALTILVGDGGAGGASGASGVGSQGSKGSDSSVSGSGITTLPAVGGGGGSFDAAAVNGGSGGGATCCLSTTKGLGTAGQGNAGGDGYVGESHWLGGAGGGAGTAGIAATGPTISAGNPTTYRAGLGGAGAAIGWISIVRSTLGVGVTEGTNVYFAGGGGGGTAVSGTGGTGGLGGGGNGSTYTGSPTAGAANTGGGGGGAGVQADNTTVAGGKGGSGVVVLRYITNAPSISTQPTNTTVKSYTDATISVETTSTPTGVTRSYQWQSSTDSGANYSNISGATLVSYTFTAVEANDNNKRYRVIVTDTATDSSLARSTTSNAAILTVSPETASWRTNNYRNHSLEHSTLCRIYSRNQFGLDYHQVSVLN